jgi:NADPH:quinone reductase-like Zn-dependent oxidoreductase
MTMKEAQVAKDLSVTIKDVPIPEPQANQVVIKVVVSGSNPKDWYVAFNPLPSIPPIPPPYERPRTLLFIQYLFFHQPNEPSIN